MTLNHQNAQTCSLRYLYYSITLNISVCFGPQGTIIRESNQSNMAQNEISHFFTQLTWCERVRWL